MLSGDGGSGVDGIDTVPPAPVVSDPDLAGLVVAVESAVAELAGQGSVAWSNADRRAVIQRMETVSRSVTAYSHTWLNELIAQHGLDVYPGSVPCSVAWMLRITPRAAGARVRLAAELGDRTALSGEVLPPLLPRTAAAVRAGLLDAQHVQMIREFFRHLPSSVDPQTRDRAEQQLVGLASTRRPDDFAPLVAHLDSILDPDGDFDENEDEDEDKNAKPRPRKRDAFFYLGEQGSDGMSEGKFCVDSELRAYLEALFSKAAKPGVNNPADPTSIVHEDEADSKATAEQPEPTSEPSSGDAGSSDAGLWDGTTRNGDSNCSDDDCGDEDCCEGDCGECDGDDDRSGDGRGEGECTDSSDFGCGTTPHSTPDTNDTNDDAGSDSTAEPGGHADADASDTAARDAAAARDRRT
ncbi:DUF222 domain-containing protein, partial [Rhodococcus fascians]|nr:DUF222 domain-containing protein [Rhodococcus fascians]MBY3866429.1 DUF222 domain-containing protein [Rhodococcus fascians]MBY3905794.1 DUF222 domain-containing protein [Rhodococcus fascians]MBY4119273.1 DUF222 domain-containing protein [Rhodococcus fascians]MBY4145734.1 DUF222 domain-containing protein [Rhodococcus fascians]